MKLIFLHGLPGVGKLTVARELAELTGFKLFHNHLTVDLALSIFEFGSPPFVALREKVWLEAFTQAVDARLPGLIFTFAFERTVSGTFIQNVRRTVESDGGEVIFVKLECSPEELERRLTNPTRKPFGKLTSLEQFHELNDAGAFVHPEVPEDRMGLDTTHLTASEAASRIADKLGLGY
jgi:hypothetical protein